MDLFLNLLNILVIRLILEFLSMHFVLVFLLSFFHYIV